MAAPTVFLALLALLAGHQAYAQQAPTLAGALASEPQLSTLLTLVQNSALLNASLNPATNVTVFAPVNDAFATALQVLKLNATQLIANKGLLNAALGTHVVPTPALSTQLRNGQVLPTIVTGVSLRVVINGTNVFIVSPGSTAKVIRADIKVGNSVVHVVDTVLLPTPI